MIGIANIITGLIIIAGAIFTLAAAIGVLRLPDVYSRSHAASKAGTFGSGLMLLALALYAGDLGIAARALAAFIFLLLTAPIAAHLLARSAYCVGHPAWSGTKIDQLSGKYTDDGKSLRCQSHDEET
ncbi:MAG: monovalent cation/H(+) antiporter subunit G [Pseudomonadota bacterium]